jgi:hypothetical protein
MQPLDKTLRNRLEKTVKEAREVAESAAKAVLEQLGVKEKTPFLHLTESERDLRRKLRAHGRMLFARFLAENNLLMYPDPDDPVAVTLEECEDLVAGTLQDVTAGYCLAGWQADHAALMALAPVKASPDVEAITAAIRAIYEPWLQASARYLQKIVQEAGYPGGTIASKAPSSFNENECLLFVDGLRFDAAKKLAELVAGQGCQVEEEPKWAALPSVTATGKPSVTPIRDQVFGFDTHTDFEPSVRDTGQEKRGANSGTLIMKATTGAGS